MAGYEREVFHSYSKEKLLNYIEEQNETIGRVETRFRGQPDSEYMHLMHQ